MKNNFFCRSPYINLYEKPYYNSKIASQILYGENFKILSKKKNFYKIKNLYDGYIGYIKLFKKIGQFKPSHKIITLRSRIFKSPKICQNISPKNFYPFQAKYKSLKKKKNLSCLKKINGYIQKILFP